MTPLNRLKVLREVATKLPLQDQCLTVMRHEVGWNQETFCSTGRSGGCKTTACLAGWGGLDPRLRRDGLKTVFTNIYGQASEGLELDGEVVMFDDLAEFFGLTRYETETLFDADLNQAIGKPYYNIDVAYDEEGRKLLVERIDALIEEHKYDAT